MEKTVENPAHGVRYSLSVHGEPPEGVEVLWRNERSGMGFWCIWRATSDTHWMRAPEDAPVPEQPPFPLSREEWEAAASDPEYPTCNLSDALYRVGGRKLQGWWLDDEESVDGEYDTVVAAWHAAGCPGATPSTPVEAEPDAPQEGPWRVWACQGLGMVGGGSVGAAQQIYRDYRVVAQLEDLISTANRAHELEGALREARGRVLSGDLLMEDDAVAELECIFDRALGEGGSDEGK